MDKGNYEGDADLTAAPPPPVNTARVAGSLYLLASGSGFFGIIYVSRTLIVPGNATATANNILASDLLFRLGIISELISAIILLLMAHAMYRLFKGVDKQYASLLVTFVAVSVPISFLNVLNEIAALNLLKGEDFLSIFQTTQLDAMAMVFLGLHSAGIAVATVFWGLWLFPFGVLVIKSGFIPRILGVLLIIACFAYLANSFTYFLVPFYSLIVSEFMVVPEAVGEGSIMVWLLIKGVKQQSLNAPTA